MSQTAARQAPQPDPPRLFLVSRRAGEYSSFLERLADIYHLYPYGRAGLSGIVRSESERAAFVLTIVFCFDLLAWSLIWNAVFERGQLAVDWMTTFAVLIGLLFASIVLTFEQGFIASDWRVRGPGKRAKLAAAAILRIAVIGASAWATSQPLELLVFANDIQDRVHQERVWEEIAAQATEFKHLQQEEEGNGSMKPKADRMIKSEAALNKVRADIAVNQTKLKAREAERESVQNTLPRLQEDERTKQRTYQAAQQQGQDLAQQELKKATAAVARANGKIGKLTGEIEQLQTEDASLGAERSGRENTVNESKEDLKSYTKDLEGQEKALRAWVRKLSLSRPGKDVNPPPDGVEPFVERPYSFAEQRRVLDDLRFARPIERHNFASVQPLLETLGLKDPGKADEDTAADRKALAQVMNQFYYALLVAALFIPAMGLIFKLTIHARLGDYYSEEYQAASGHPEAIQAVQTDDFLNRRSEDLRSSDDRYRGGHIL